MTLDLQVGLDERRADRREQTQRVALPPMLEGDMRTEHIDRLELSADGVEDRVEAARGSQVIDIAPQPIAEVDLKLEIVSPVPFASCSTSPRTSTCS